MNHRFIILNEYVGLCMCINNIHGLWLWYATNFLRWVDTKFPHTHLVQERTHKRPLTHSLPYSWTHILATYINKSETHVVIWAFRWSLHHTHTHTHRRRRCQRRPKGEEAGHSRTKRRTPSSRGEQSRHKS